MSLDGSSDYARQANRAGSTSESSRSSRARASRARRRHHRRRRKPSAEIIHVLPCARDRGALNLGEVILDSNRAGFRGTPRVFRDSKKERTLVYRNQSLRAVLRDLGRREITSVLIEGGGDVLGSGPRPKINRQSANLHRSDFHWRRRAGVWGNGAASTPRSLRLDSPRYERIGPDICITGYPKKAMDFTVRINPQNFLADFRLNHEEEVTE